VEKLLPDTAFIMITIRPVTKEDYPRILEIYNPYITETTFSFEYEAVSLPAFSARADAIREHFPFIVAEEDGVIQGYAYLSEFHTRAAYRFTVDLSIYCDMNCRGRGIGTLLYNEIEKIAVDSGFANIVAIITDRNDASLSFHKRMGFTEEAHFTHVAYKMGAWRGVYYLIKNLHPSDDEPFFTGRYGKRP